MPGEHTARFTGTIARMYSKATSLRFSVTFILLLTPFLAPALAGDDSGPDSKELWRDLESDDVAVVRRCAQLLFERAREDPSVVDPLLRVVNHEDEKVRRLAVLGLSRVDGDDRVWTALVTRALRDRREEKTSGAQSILWYRAETNDAAFQAIVDLTKSRKKLERSLAVNLLSYIEGRDREIPEALLGILEQDDDPGLRADAAARIGSLRTRDPKILRALETALDSEDMFIRLEAAWALARAGSAKKPASKKLLRFLDDEDSGVRAAAAFGSRGMGVELERVTSALVKAIEEATAFIYSFDALAALGAGARSAALFLVEYAENEGGVSLPPLAHVAVGDRKLERKTVELARKYLRSEEGGEVSRAAEAIAVLGPAGVAALPDLRKLLREPVERDLSLYEVMRALGAIGAPAGVATEEMLAAVEAHCSYEKR